MRTEGEPTIRKKGALGAEKEPVTRKDIESVLKNEISKEKEDIEGFTKYISNRFKKMSRRDFLKIAAVLTAAGTVGVYEYFRREYQKVEEVPPKETPPEKITPPEEIMPPEETPPPETEKEFADLSEKSNIELFRMLSEYPETIEKSKKQTLKDFAKDLSEKNFDSLILGQQKGPLDEGRAVELLEELIKNDRKISVIGFQGASGVSPIHIELMEKFNKGELSREELQKPMRYLGAPLLDLARKHSIEIAGLEGEKMTDDENDMRRKDLDVFKQMSERAGELAKQKKKEGIAVSFVTQPHATIDSWENENILRRLQGLDINSPPRKEVLENNYTIKEHLEEIGLNPVAVQIEDWGRYVRGVRGGAQAAFSQNPRHLEEANKILEEKYLLEEERDFVVPYPKGRKNTFALIIPGYDL